MYFYVATRKKTLIMVEILRSLRDGGELRLMNGDNNPDGIICHDCGFCSSVSEKLIVSRDEVMTTITTIHQRWGQLQRQ